MKWHKLGLIHTPRGDNWWASNLYTFNPTVAISDDALRVYFASLDENNYGRVGYVDLDADDPRKVLHIATEPVLDIGPLGAFDDSGVNPSCVVRVAGRDYLYYIGWQRCERVPYMLFSGLAIREPGNENIFKRHSSVPIFDRTAEDPFSRSAPCVLAEEGGYRAWYWSCERWTVENDWVHYNNVIRHAESADGIKWQSTGHICVAPTGPDEYSIGRPWVVKDAIYRMWYSVRSRAQVSYSIGYAESADGLAWERKDEEVGIATSETGWDSEMICHPCVVDIRGQRFMFYNGNRHGREGFGCAVLASD